MEQLLGKQAEQRLFWVWLGNNICPSPTAAHIEVLSMNTGVERERQITSCSLSRNAPSSLLDHGRLKRGE